MMVLQLIVSASATARTPPRPNESASFAAHNLVPRSPRCGCSRSYFSRTIRFRSSRTFQYSRRFSCLPPRQSFSATRGIPLSAGSPNMLYHETEDLSSPTAVWEVISSRLLGNHFEGMAVFIGASNHFAEPVAWKRSVCLHGFLSFVDGVAQNGERNWLGGAHTGLARPPSATELDAER